MYSNTKEAHAAGWFSRRNKAERAHRQNHEDYRDRQDKRVSEAQQRRKKEIAKVPAKKRNDQVKSEWNFLNGGK